MIIKCTIKFESSLSASGIPYAPPQVSCNNAGQTQLQVAKSNSQQLGKRRKWAHKQRKRWASEQADRRTHKQANKLVGRRTREEMCEQVSGDEIELRRLQVVGEQGGPVELEAVELGQRDGNSRG